MLPQPEIHIYRELDPELYDLYMVMPEGANRIVARMILEEFARRAASGNPVVIPKNESSSSSDDVIWL
uniref:Transcriptional regulator n=1 Tax=Steinernema glaseri TaxID=37863 RepID=A0A1I7ZXU9_9BILA